MKNPYTELYLSSNFRDNSTAIMHYRTKGSKNGYSTDPNYTPIGEKAKMINGKYVSPTGGTGGKKIIDDGDLTEAEKNYRSRLNNHPTGGTGGKKIIDDNDVSESEKAKSQRILDNAKKISGVSAAKKELDPVTEETDAAELFKKKSQHNKEYNDYQEKQANKSVYEARKDLIKARDAVTDAKYKYGSSTDENARTEKLAATLKEKQAKEEYERIKEERNKKLKTDTQHYIDKIMNRLRK